jgi:hypothetical protein
MKRLVFALALVATVGACKKAEQQPASSQPAMSDSSSMMMSDSSKMMSDSSKMMMDTTKH